MMNQSGPSSTDDHAMVTLVERMSVTVAVGLVGAVVSAGVVTSTALLPLESRVGGVARVHEESVRPAPARRHCLSAVALVSGPSV